MPELAFKYLLSKVNASAPLCEDVTRNYLSKLDQGIFQTSLVFSIYCLSVKVITIIAKKKMLH